MKLSGKVAVITGAARGIGRACAERFLSDGCKVVISDVDRDNLAKTAGELAHPDDLRTIVCDVARRADVDRMVREPAAYAAQGLGALAFARLRPARGWPAYHRAAMEDGPWPFGAFPGPT